MLSFGLLGLPLLHDVYISETVHGCAAIRIHCQVPMEEPVKCKEERGTEEVGDRLLCGYGCDQANRQT
jgi:hypothetical protein